MSKLAIAVLTVAAFVYALWLVVFRGALPQPGRVTGLRRRFCLATLLFVGLLTTTGGRAGEPMPTCYTPPPLPPPQTQSSTGRQAIITTLQAVWRTLDPAKDEEFRRKIESAVADGQIRHKVGDMLNVAYTELVRHKSLGGKAGVAVCYTMNGLGHRLLESRERAMVQVELLAKARTAGTVNEETASKAHAALARELELLYRVNHASQADRSALGWQVVDDYRRGKIIPGDSAQVAAAMIVEMEGGKVADLTPGRRLMDMKQRVRDSFKTRLKTNDWQDPEIQPNLAEILARADLLSAQDVAPNYTCYSRAFSPVEERSEELAALQKRLLDKHLLLGTLDGKRYIRLIEAQRRKDAEIEAHLADVTEADLQTFQEKVREVVRTLYKEGEVPPSLVAEVEQAIDVDALAFKPGEAIRAEVGFCLRSRIRSRRHRQVLTWLEQRKLIPPADSCRGEMTGEIETDSYRVEQQARMKALKQALNGDESVSLPGDEAVRIDRSTLPEQDIDYRLEMRRVLRLLVKNGLLNQRYDLKPIEECLGIPIIGTLEQSQTAPS